MSTRRPRGDDGQGAVEVALALPVLVMLMLGVVQVVLVARDQLAVVHAARESARAAAVVGGTTAGAQTAGRSATALDPARLDITVAGGEVVKATVRYRSPTDVPLVGRLLPDVLVSATAVMQREP
jgi:Flp pilus assembly protein TadG